MQKKFNVYLDPGHGWMKVPVSLLERLGVAGKISSYSYRRGDFAYLEEDCDAGIFITAYKAAFGDSPVFSVHNSDRPSRIRSYESFRHSVDRNRIF